MIHDGLQIILKRHNVKLAVVGCLADGSIEKVGTADGLRGHDLIQSLFGDHESLMALDHSLEGQLMPRLWAQGEVGCVVCKPVPSHLVGLFYVETRNVVEKYRWSKVIAKEVNDLFATGQ